MKRIPILMMAGCLIATGYVKSQSYNFYDSSQSNERFRTVVWMHGLTGEDKNPNKVLWYNFVNDFNTQYAKPYTNEGKLQKNMMVNYLLNSYDYENSKTAGVEALANFVAQRENHQSLYVNFLGGGMNVPLQYTKNPNNNSIFIGHSLGGLVGRELDRRQYAAGYPNTPRFGGMITAGSPLNGAKIAQSTKPYWWSFYTLSTVSLFGANTIYQLGRGPASYIPIIGQGLQGSLSGITILLGGVIDALALPSFEQTSKDLLPNSPYIQATKDIETPTHKLQIWGNEDLPIFKNLIGNPPSYTNYMNWAYGNFEVLRWIPGFAFSGTEWLSTYDYGTYAINGGWMNIIDDGVIWETQSFRYMRGFQVLNCFTSRWSVASQKCSKWGWWSWLCKPFVYIYEVVKCIMVDTWRYEDHYYQVPSYGASDGVVAAHSARADGSKWRGKDIDGAKEIIRADGVNHLEMGKHTEMKKIFESIFDGNRAKNNTKSDAYKFLIIKDKFKP